MTLRTQDAAALARLDWHERAALRGVAWTAGTRGHDWETALVRALAAYCRARAAGATWGDAWVAAEVAAESPGVRLGSETAG